MSSQHPRKYTRPRHLISWFGLIVGVILGAGAGLFYAWQVDPVDEYDTQPWQLNDSDRAHYIAAITMAFERDGDLDRAVNRLLELRLPDDPFQAVADTACQLATTSYVETNGGLRAVRSMMLFYRLQAKQGCADNLIPAVDVQPTNVVDVVVPTATLIPPATKTSTPASPDRPTPTPVRIIVPTSPPENDFVLVNINTFCDAELSGLIEVYVQDFSGEGIPGQQVRVRWDTGENSFYTGLKPERGPGYADFEMTEDRGYIVEMPGRSDPISDPLIAVPCNTGDGTRALTSYRVVFRPST